MTDYLSISELTLYSTFIAYIQRLEHIKRLLDVMRMQDPRSKSLRVLALCILVMVVAPLPIQSYIESVPSNKILSSEFQDINEVQSTKDSAKDSRNFDDVPFEISDDEISPPPLEGVIDPVQIEQSGYSSTGNISSRTDTMVNTEQSLSFDTGHDWVVSDAQLEVSNLEKLYVVNGSFDEGSPGYTINPNGTLLYHPNGWSATSANGDPTAVQAQQVSYEVGGDRYVSVQNIAKLTNFGQSEYTHYTDTNVTWNQVFDNVPYTSDFLLQFRYLLLQGPLNPLFSGNYSLKVFIDNDVVETIDLPNLSNRGIWFDSGTISVNIASPSPSMTIKIGLVIDNEFKVRSTVDYDGDGSPDGVINTQYITVLLDDVSLISPTPPNCESVDLRLVINGVDTPVYGTAGTGYGILSNPLNWNTSPLNFSISSNTSISLDYNAILFNHRYLETRPTTNTLEYGVSYSITPGQSGALEMFTYLGFIGEYSDFTIKIYHPSDWQNFSVFDPFLSNVTADCSQFEDFIQIPTIVLDVLGWWEISCQSPNYGDESQTQRYDTDVGSWVEDTLYHTGDMIRLSANISSQGNIPSLSDGVRFKWGLPNYTIWHESFIVSGSVGSITSTSTTLGATNTTAGQWYISYFWTNQTEVAYGTSSFQVYHSTTLTSYETIIESESGLSVTNFVYFQDSENDEFITDSSASVTANWSTTTVTFVPDIIQNRWVGTFDTSLIEPGDNLVIVNASSTYFDDASCTFIVRIRYTDNQLTLFEPTAEIGLGEKYTAYFNYSDAFGSGISDANVSIEYSGAAEGITWGTVIDLGGGDYSIEFTSVHSGSYAITISASKDYYVASQDALFLFVGAVTTNLSLENGTSAIIGFGEQYRLVLRYTNVSDYGLDGANVSIVSSTPATGISYGTINGEGDGYYSIILTPEDPDTFTLLVKISLADHTTQYASFTLTATLISTHLRVSGASSPATIGVEQPFELLVLYEQTGVISENISQADIHLAFTSYGNLTYTVTPLTEGYLISLQTDKIGSYTFNIYASKTGYQSDFQTFTLFVRERGMQVIMESPVWTRLSSLEITLALTDSITNESITDAIVSYLLLKSGNPIMDGNLTESEVTPGVYSITINPEWLDDTGYSIQISANKPNFALDGDYEFPVLQYTPPDILVRLMVRVYGPPIGIIAVVAIVSVAGLRVRSKKQNAKRMKAREIKSRFSDANNLLGIIVLHKMSGIPIYSKILKGGFEEGMLSAFISAIMHFRSEFDTARSASDEYRIIPISDIIRAIPTQNLVCAFITITSSSPEQEVKMIGYARAIGMTMDDVLSQRPTQIVDVKTAKTLEWYFDDFVDGGLIRKYQVSEKKLPRRFKIIESTMREDSARDTFSLRRLIRNLETSGLSEDDAYLLVMDAIEGEFIVPVYPFNGEALPKTEES